jgi:D-serine dehydratase
MGLTSWVVGKATEDLLKNRLGVSDTRKRKRVVREIKKMVKLKHEPVALGGFAGVGAAIFAAFGLELSPADLALTVSTVITVITFIQRKLVSPVAKKDQP